MALLELFYQKQMAEQEHPTEDSLKDKILKLDEDTLFNIVSDYNKDNGFAEVSYKMEAGIAKQKFFDSSAKYFMVKNCAGVRYLDSANSLFDFVSVEELESYVKDNLDKYQSLITDKFDPEELRRELGTVKLSHKARLKLLNEALDSFRQSNDDYLMSCQYELERLRDIYETKKSLKVYKAAKDFISKSLTEAEKIKAIPKKTAKEKNKELAGTMSENGKDLKNEYRSLYKNHSSDIKTFGIDKMELKWLELAPKAKQYLGTKLTFEDFYKFSNGEQFDKYLSDLTWDQAVFQLEMALDKYVKKAPWQEDIKKLKKEIIGDLENVFDIIFNKSGKFVEFEYEGKNFKQADKTTALNKHKSKIETVVKNVNEKTAGAVENKLHNEENAISELKDKFLKLENEGDEKAIDKFKGELIQNILKK